MSASYDFERKSSVEQIRERFDGDVDRFSSLEAGHTAAIDSRVCLDLIANCAAGRAGQMQRVLDLGCGAGNFTLKLIERLHATQGLDAREKVEVDVTLCDLSPRMLARAAERVGAETVGRVETIEADMRDLELGIEAFDAIIAGAVLHHLRGDEEWRAVFGKLHAALKRGAALWVFDLICHDDAQVQSACWKAYGRYLVSLGGEAYRDDIFAYIEAEDTPRSLAWQGQVLRDVGFGEVEVLHKNTVMAAFYAAK